MTKTIIRKDMESKVDDIDEYEQTNILNREKLLKLIEVIENVYTVIRNITLFVFGLYLGIKLALFIVELTLKFKHN